MTDVCSLYGFSVGSFPCRVVSLRRGPRSSSLPGRVSEPLPRLPASLKPGLFPEWSLLVHSIISSPGHRWLRSCGMLQRTCSGSNRPTRTTDAITRTAMPLLLSTSFRTVLHRVGAGIYCSRVQPVLIVHNHFSPPDPGPEVVTAICCITAMAAVCLGAAVLHPSLEPSSFLLAQGSIGQASAVRGTGRPPFACPAPAENAPSQAHQHVTLLHETQA